MKIAVLGAGAWGTALAIHAAARHDVTLWSRSAAVVAEIRDQRRNTRYLPGAALPSSLAAREDFARVAGPADLIVVATSVAGLRPVLSALANLPANGCGADRPAVAWLSKGLEADTGLFIHQIVASLLPAWAAGCLSGPSFAQEVAAGLPVALSAAASRPWLAQQMVDAFHHGPMRVYTSDDLTGVEIAGALKNVMAIATGISDGLGLGLNARAALLTRGLAEITRFGLAHGAQSETFLGLAGDGDRVLTGTGDLSRNRTVGRRLAAGERLADILAALGHVAEGVVCCRAVVARARAIGVDLPISEAVLAVLDERLGPADAVVSLLAREPKKE